MLRDREDDVQVSGRAAVWPGVSFPREPQTAAGLDAGGDPDRELPGRSAASVPPAVGARLLDDPSLAAAVSAGASDGQEPLGETLAAGAAADGAGLCASTGLRAGAFAGVARLEPGNHERGLDSKGGVVERDLHPVHEVAAAGRPRRPAPREPEDLSEQVRQVEGGRVEAEPGAGPAPDPRVAETVVPSAFLRVGEHRVGLGGFLEPLRRLRIVRVAVRVALERDPPVGGLELRRRGFAFHSENLVIVAFGAHL